MWQHGKPQVAWQNNRMDQLPLNYACNAPFLSHHCRVGYLTLFGGEQDNRSPDASRVYEAYKTFDGLLTKLARGTLWAGIDARYIPNAGTSRSNQIKFYL